MQGQLTLELPKPEIFVEFPLAFGGVRREDLFLFEPEPRLLDWILRGTYNLQLPEELWDNINPDEKLAMFMAAGKFKQNNAHLLKGEQDALDLIRRMNNFAYHREIVVVEKEGYGKGEVEGYSPLREMWSNNPNVTFSNGPGEQRKRLEKLDLSEFLDSYNSPYIPAERSTPTLPENTDVRKYVAHILYKLDSDFSVKVPSESQPGLDYMVRVDERLKESTARHAPVSCECPSNQKGHRLCKHIKKAVFFPINSDPKR